MYSLISRMVLYRNLEEDSILMKIADIIRKHEKYKGHKDFTSKQIHIVSEINSYINQLIRLSIQYGLDGNLWHNYLTYIIMTQENPFTMLCERSGPQEGTINKIVKEDFKILKKLFNYDFNVLEKDLSINCFAYISNFKVNKKTSNSYKQISLKIKKLCKKIELSKDHNEMFDCVTEFYKTYGVGQLGLNKAFRVKKIDNKTIIEAVTDTLDVKLSNLIGYELQKKKLFDNTKAFVQGKKANNVLLYGDSGTGKSTAIKAILNEFYDQGLRIIEIYKHQFNDLLEVISQIKDRNYKFIIYMDDLSFEDFEIEYKYLKAVIEGGLEMKPNNVLIYATSNRRHLIRETWGDRSDMRRDEEIHVSDTMQEKLSLVDRFGITINFSAPSKKEFEEIVVGLAQSQGIELPREELLDAASRWELLHGGKSGRTAQQFINYLLSNA